MWILIIAFLAGSQGISTQKIENLPSRERCIEIADKIKADFKASNTSVRYSCVEAIPPIIR